MKTLFIKALVVLFICFVGCTTIYKMPFRPICAQKALYTALVSNQYHSARIAWGRIHGSLHVQAQIWINGRWQWITTKQGSIYLSPRDEGFLVERYLTSAEFMRWYIQWLERR